VERRLELLREDIEELDGKGEQGLLSNEDFVVRKHKFKEL